MNCQNCSNPLTPGAKFCGNCGVFLQSDSTVQQPQPVVATAATAGAPIPVDSAPYAPMQAAEALNTALQPVTGHVDSAGPVSVKGPAVAGIILGAVYLLGSAIAYVEGFQYISNTLMIAMASIDIFLGLLIFVPGVLLLTTNKVSPSALLKTEYIAAVVVVVLSVVSFRLASLLFVIPALLARRAHLRLQNGQ